MKDIPFGEWLMEQLVHFPVSVFYVLKSPIIPLLSMMIQRAPMKIKSAHDRLDGVTSVGGGAGQTALG